MQGSVGLHWEGGSESRQKGRKDVEGKWGEINRQLNWKVAEREGEVRLKPGVCRESKGSSLAGAKDTRSVLRHITGVIG